MQLSVDAVLPFPRERVFAAYRDRLVDTVPHLPNIRAIVVASRKEEDDDVLLVNEWTGGGDIPAVARAFVKEDMLKWTDHARWRHASFAVEWRTDIHAFPGAVVSAGENRFVEVAAGTRLEIRGEFSLDAAKIPGVPRLIAKSVGGAVEKFFVHQIQVNGVAVAKAVSTLLAAEK